MDYPTLSRFFRLHFLFPFILLALAGAHIVVLHETGSRNPLGIGSGRDKAIFYPYYLAKDTMGFLIVPGSLILLFFMLPWVFTEYQKFIPANSLVTPPHIQPEWYFLAAYAVLRAIPSKLGGVIALVAFVAILLILPVFANRKRIGDSWVMQLFYWVWVSNFLLLT